VVPFLEDMPSAISWADLVISRSGASAVSEICAIGRPSILVPFPYAAGAHQLKNARALEAIGAAICMESSEANLQSVTACILRFQESKELLQEMSHAARNWGRPDAARAIARDLIAFGSSEHSRVEPGHGSHQGHGGTDV
jgi:UDP-N-acetylglucosamine--N-acetylmuramyl-(pentapeptide) pyrophosphoryl-undecaprenol N-acetylglucosamine transferase